MSKDKRLARLITEAAEYPLVDVMLALISHHGADAVYEAICDADFELEEQE